MTQGAVGCRALQGRGTACYIIGVMPHGQGPDEPARILACLQLALTRKDESHEHKG